MGSPRLLGKQLLLEVDGEEYQADIISCIKKAEPNGDQLVTFEDAAGGEVFQWYFEITAVQSTQATSFHTFCEEHVGEVLPFTYAPQGNATAAANQPLYTGTCEVAAPPDLGGEAGRKKQQQFQVRFDIIGTPVKDVTP
jgi:hypothetical protein